MAQEKIIYSRQQQKHDIEANWIKAVNFIPKEGEIIIYDAENATTDLTGTDRTVPITYPRIKTGDGITTVTLLPFTKGENEVYIGTEEMPEGYTLWINPEGDALDLENYITKEEAEQLISQDKAIVVVANGSTLSHTNAQIYEAAQNGRDIFLFLWGDTYLKATFIAPTYAWFEASYDGSTVVDGASYYGVRYRLFSIQNDKLKENGCYLTRLDDFVALKNQVGDIDTALDSIIAIQNQLIGGDSV